MTDPGAGPGPGPGPAAATAGPMAVRMGTATGRWVLLATILGSGIAGIDATVVNVALPAIGADLHTEFTSLQWTVTAYTLTLAAFILLGGSLGDRFGRRRIFEIGVAWFAIASLLCGIAPNAPLLIAARALQGIGGALLTPGSLSIIQASFAHDDRAAAIGAWSGLGGVATAIGPFLGGWLIEYVNWRWIFLINPPLAAAVIIISRRHVPESRNEAETGRVDIPGAVLGVVGLAGITYAIIEAPVAAPVVTIVSAVIGVAAFAGFILIEARTATPLLPLDIFRSRQFTATNAVTFAIYGAFGGVFFLLAVQLQVVAGFSPLAAGIASLPLTVLMLLGSSAAGRLGQRIGPRLPMSVGPLICAGGVLLMLRIGPGANYLTDVLPAIIVFGLGVTLLVAPLTATALASADDAHAGIASGVNNAVARAAGLLAVATLPAVAGLSGNSYRQPVVFQHGFQLAVIIAAGMLAGAGLLAAITVRANVLTAAPTLDQPAAGSDRSVESEHGCR